VRDALSYAQDVLGMGAESNIEEGDDPAAKEARKWIKELPAELATQLGEHARTERHLTGQELCHAIREYALQQYGMMAKVVLNSWGVHSTSDIGNIVYNLIDIGLMRKSNEDRREDFDDVYDFQQAFEKQFQISP
jgi:uncharacterized repeat protein (TIGR04138 family)